MTATRMLTFVFVLTMPGWRGGLLGFGRCVPPGDKDFNCGSMIGK